MYLDWHHGHTRAHLFRHVYENFTAVKQLQRPYNPQMAEQTLPLVQQTLKQINDHWLERGYVGGLENISIADLFLYGEIAQLLLVVEKGSVKDSQLMHNLPNIRNWMTKMENLQYFEEMHKLLPTIRSKFKDIPLR
jgi:hypothetical protein